MAPVLLLLLTVLPNENVPALAGCCVCVLEAPPKEKGCFVGGCDDKLLNDDERIMGI